MHHRATCPNRVLGAGSSGAATVGEPVSEAMGDRDGEVGMAPARPRGWHVKVPLGKGGLKDSHNMFW